MGTAVTNGTTVSFSNTSQAKDDYFGYAQTLLTEDNLAALGWIALDVMANDLGGNAKTLYSIDNTNATDEAGNPYAYDLLKSDVTSGVSLPEFTDFGAQIKIYNGKIYYNAASISGTYLSALQALQVGQSLTDSFTYAIKMSNGAISWATVKVQIAGANDPAVLSSDTRNLTETNSAADISTSGTLTISDVDSPATFVAQAGTAGLYGTFAIDAAGNWTYTASSAHNEFVGGTTYTDTFDVVSADGTHTSVTIHILGTNDAAVLSSDTKNLTETDSAAGISASGTLTISDVDSPATFVAQAGTAGLYGTFTIDAAGNWTYTASSAHDEFVDGVTYTDVFEVVSADGTHTTVTVNILGTNDAAVLGSDSKHLTEGNTAATISTSGTLTISDVDSPATFVPQLGTAGAYGTFSINAGGAWTYTASSAHDEFVDGVTYTDTFSVSSADSTLTSITIHILGTNDAAILSADVRNLTETNSAADISTSGTLTISDVDSPATFVAQVGTAGAYGTFSIDAAGNWTYTASSAHDEFVDGVTYTDTFPVSSADGTLTSVTINILGANDAAILSSDTKNLTETNSAADISTSGTLTISDVDSPATFVAQAATAGAYGTFSIDAAGNWTYTASSAHNEFVAGTTYTDTFSVSSADGTLTSVTMNILGTNDAAVLSADVRNLTETNAAADISTSGTLTISDVDSPATFVAQVGTVGSYGTFSINAAGAWTYTASSAHDEFVEGITYTDVFDVVSADGTHTSVTIHILGTNDAAILSADVRNLTETNSAVDISTSGNLTISDVDSPASFVAQAGTVGTYGTFTIDAAGAWTYTASSAHNEFVEGVTYTDTFDVLSADGTHTSVTINTLGTNDAAVLSSDTKNLTEAGTAAAISTSGTLTISDVDNPATFVAQGGTVGSYGTFSINTVGAWTYTASSAHNEFVAGTTYTDTFSVSSADGTLTSVTMNILGTNDAAVLSADVRNLTETNSVADISASGTLTISDVDSPATFVAQAGTVGSYGTFAINAVGTWTYTASSAHNEFVAGTTYTDTFDVVSADGTHTSVTINILGTNDAAVLSSDTTNLTETNSAADISTSGTLTISDVDSPATFVAQAATAGLYGTFSINAAGAWTYTASSAHDEFVGGTTYTDVFDVVSADGTHTSVTINILGTNEPVMNVAPVAKDDIWVLSDNLVTTLSADWFTRNDTDADGDKLYVTGISVVSAPSDFTFSTVTDSLGHITGLAVTDTPGSGLATLSYTLSDGTHTDTGQVTVNFLTTIDNSGTPDNINLGTTFGVTGYDFSWIEAEQGKDTVTGESTTILGTAGIDNFFGGNQVDTLSGLVGDDYLDGGQGQADKLLGGSGNDTLVWDSADELVDGGADFDTLRVAGNLNLSPVPDGQLENIERIDLSDYAADTTAETLTLNAQDVLDLEASGNKLYIMGNEIGTKDTVDIDASLTVGATTVFEGVTYVAYTGNPGTAVTVYIEQGLNVV